MTVQALVICKWTFLLDEFQWSIKKNYSREPRTVYLIEFHPSDVHVKLRRWIEGNFISILGQYYSLMTCGYF